MLSPGLLTHRSKASNKENHMRQASRRSTFAVVPGIMLIAMGTAGCRTQWLFVGNSAGPTIQAFDVSTNAQGIPKLQLLPNTPIAAGAPMSMQVVGRSLYVAAGSGQVAQFTINGNTGALTLRGTIPAGSPPYSMVATTKAVYVASRFSNDINVYSIDASENLANLQTVTVAAVNVAQLDTGGTRLFTGSRVNGPAGPQLCSHAIQTNGSLGANPNCVAIAGAPESMVFSAGVLFVHFNATVAPSLGNSNWISAWTVDPATGALARRGVDLDIGAANTGTMGLSTNGQTLFIPRQGGFSMVGTGTVLSHSIFQFPQGPAGACVLPPAGVGTVLVDPNGKAVYLADPVGAATGNVTGAKLSSLEIKAGGALAPIVCETVAGKPISLALFQP
jgi:hypothetical protein